jgi:hypothetical protein
MIAAEARMKAEKRLLRKKIASREIIGDDLSVYSRQWIEFTSPDLRVLTPAFLVGKYLAFVQKCTLCLVQPLRIDGRIAFSFLGTSLYLLIFSGPEFRETDHSQTATFCIDGGLLVQRNECGKGMLSFIIEDLAEGVLVAVEVSDYCPLLLGGVTSTKLRKWLYRCSQALIHKVITSRFLGHLQRQLEHSPARGQKNRN